MTFEKILNDVSRGIITPQEACDEISQKDKMKTIRYYTHLHDIQKEPLKASQLQELNAITNILQILYTADVGSPISDFDYDILQEMLIDMGIPRLTGSIEINDNSKVSHKYTNLRGTLDKIYYLYPDEKRTNKSRKYLDEWIRSAEVSYEKKTGKKIDLNSARIMVTPKFDGTSAILEVEGNRATWLTRGDTKNNRAGDVSHILNIFNDKYVPYGGGQKFEIMMSEDNKNKINEFFKDKPYHNSRQIVTSCLNSDEADFKCEYLTPVPLRIVHELGKIEEIHPDLIKNFPTMICTFDDRDKIKEFANHSRYVKYQGMRLRTDGAVMTILDPNIQKVLGRDNNINNFEVAYKFTEEVGYSRVKDVEFYVSEFGFITPVLVVHDVILKGNTVNHISLSNKERFDELGLSYGDQVAVHYDIIPYATIDEKCSRIPNGHKIEFIKECPRCHEKLNLDVVQVQCQNPNCPSRLIGRVLNYCGNLRIQNIGYNTLDFLYTFGFLDKGILSLYKLKKHANEIENLEGFGRLKTRKIISEIEAKRKLKDYEFFGSIGIEGLSIKTFQLIFSKIPSSKFIDMLELKNYNLLLQTLISISGIGDIKASNLIEYLKNSDNKKEIDKLLKEVSIIETYSTSANSKGTIVFTGCRPTVEMENAILNRGYRWSDSWNKSAVYLVVPNSEYTSNKVGKANAAGVPIVPVNDILDRI
jgi:DNA ligase (NAD+)